MKKLKLLWVEDDVKFGPSVHYRLEDDLADLNIGFEKPELLKSGRFVWETIRSYNPDIIMMDYNLEDMETNGHLLIIEIRLHNQDIPIVFYSSEMNDKLVQLVDGETNVFPSKRDDTAAELFRLIRDRFLDT